MPDMAEGERKEAGTARRLRSLSTLIASIHYGTLNDLPVVGLFSRRGALALNVAPTCMRAWRRKI